MGLREFEQEEFIRNSEPSRDFNFDFFLIQRLRGSESVIEVTEAEGVRRVTRMRNLETSELFELRRPGAEGKESFSVCVHFLLGLIKQNKNFFGAPSRPGPCTVAQFAEAKSRTWV